MGLLRRKGDAMEDSFHNLNEDEKNFVNLIFGEEETNLPETEGKNLRVEQISFSPSSLFPEVVERIKGSLAAMKTLAFFSRDKFRDEELGEYFYRVVSEDIEKTISVLNCFCDYLRFNSPIRKTNTVHTLIEETLKRHEREFEEKRIRIIKKQFEQDLPETTVSDEQFTYILNSVLQYIVLSIPDSGTIGLLTRLIEAQQRSGEEKNLLQKDSKYVEVLIVSRYYEKKSDSLEELPAIPTNGDKGRMDLILEMVKEVVRKNHGVIKVKWYEKKGIIFISLVLPVERRKIIHFLSSEERLKKAQTSEKGTRGNV
jgi:hypothetical protein